MQKSFLLSLTLISLVLPETKIFPSQKNMENPNPKAISFHENERNIARNKLLLNNDSSLEENEHEINYSYTYSDKKSALPVSTYSVEEPSSTKYSIKYLKSLDLMLIHSYEECGQETRENEFYGFPFVNDDGEVDIKFDINGETTTYSSIGIPGKGDFDHFPITPKVYETMKICKEIATLDDVKGIACSLILVPNLFKDGPLKYLFYLAKLRMIEDNWNDNVKEEMVTPSGMIEDQNNEEYDKRHFGYRINQSDKTVETGTIRTNGCGIIAMHNLLVDSGAKPNLASLIALTQALNADLFLGIFGVNPINEDVLDAAASILHTFFTSFILSIIEKFVYEVARTIFIDYLSKCPDWLTTVLLLTAEQIANATIELICHSIFGVLNIFSTIELFVETYLASMSDISTIIDVYAEKKYEAVKSATFDEIIENIKKYSQGIFSYWVTPGNIFGGAHTVYIRRDSDYKASIHNCKTKNIFFIDPTFKQADGYIYGYVWRKK